jgi:hypothetical protein
MAVMSMLTEPILYPCVGEVQAVSLQHRLDASESQIIGSCERNAFWFCLFGPFSLEAAEQRAVFGLPEDFHVLETGASQPLHLLLPGRPRPIEI